METLLLHLPVDLAHVVGGVDLQNLLTVSMKTAPQMNKCFHLADIYADWQHYVLNFK